MKSREFKLDFLRAIAILSVIYCHSIESYYYIYTNRVELWNIISVPSRLFDLIGITIGRIGVPIFMFLTGILAAKKEYNNSEDTKKFYKKNFLSLFITLEIWVIIWNLFIKLFQFIGGETPTITIFTALRNVFLMKTVDFILPAWYVPAILGLYLFLPVISTVFNKFSLKDLKIPIIISIIVMYLFPTLNELRIIPRELSTDLDMFFSGGIYGIYILLGNYIYKGSFKNLSNKLLYFLIVLSFSLCVIMQYYLLSKGIAYKLHYDNLFLFIGCALLLELIRRSSITDKISEKGKSVISYLSLISFPLFLIHNLVQYLIYHYSSFILFAVRPIRVIYIFFLSLLISSLIVYLLSKVSIFKKYLLRMK